MAEKLWVFRSGKAATSYDGCFFQNHIFKTTDPDKATLLFGSAFFNTGFELVEEIDLGAPTPKVAEPEKGKEPDSVNYLKMGYRKLQQFAREIGVSSPLNIKKKALQQKVKEKLRL